MNVEKYLPMCREYVQNKARFPWVIWNEIMIKKEMHQENRYILQIQWICGSLEEVSFAAKMLPFFEINQYTEFTG